MYHMIATKNRAHFGHAQHSHQRQIGRESADLRAPASRSIQRRQQQRDFSAADCIAYLLKPGNSETAAARQTDRFTATLGQHTLDPTSEFRRYGYRTACGTREELLCRRLLENLTARRQPQTPARKIACRVGDELAVGTDDKSEQAGAVMYLTRCDAPAERPCDLRRFIPSNSREVVDTARSSYSLTPASTDLSSSSYQ
jgi:hypothetical protein